MIYSHAWILWGFVVPIYDSLSQLYFHLWGSFHFFSHKLASKLSQAGRIKIKTKIKSKEERNNWGKYEAKKTKI